MPERTGDLFEVAPRRVGRISRQEIEFACNSERDESPAKPYSESSRISAKLDSIAPVYLTQQMRPWIKDTL